MESSIAVFLLRWATFGLLPTLRIASEYQLLCELVISVPFVVLLPLGPEDICSNSPSKR